jgi:hypothetical protein
MGAQQQGVVAAATAADEEEEEEAEKKKKLCCCSLVWGYCFMASIGQVGVARWPPGSQYYRSPDDALLYLLLAPAPGGGGSGLQHAG